MKEIQAGVLNVRYLDVGPIDGPVAVLLHGFPYDVHAYDEVATTLAAAGCRCIIPYLRGYGGTSFVSPDTLRSGEQAALGADLLALLDALNIETAVIAGYDWGGRAASVVAALWPERVTGLVSCEPGYNIQDIANASIPVAPETEHRLWYQYYLHSARGHAGLEASRDAFCRLLWKQWSPTWHFSDQTFAASSQSFQNSDFVDVVTHSYRHRFGLVAGDPQYAHIQNQLALQPDISVPTVILAGSNDGVTPAQSEQQALLKFTGYARRLILDGVGHNVPQEAPADFAQAVLSLLHL
ncbi:alpha/beta hydrolase [Pseudomonas syringae pv. actinidiae]|nr:alpha/beta hydrolase [Pseudomonas syringae]AYL15852.1 alpha/beta hydrolase [Pseudomonas syringae pv. actinidiae]OSR51212.1 Haloalkane dehalogenase [Pseudomonas syringae pv. actinidiae]OSR68257.1 Haloalkane dehalogenase [Pseudomonas syringae pv. actinidiae]